MTTERAGAIARAAVEVLGERGAAGLTHRAVDRHAAMPEGSTSNHFRTRGALIEGVCQFLTEHDLAQLKEASAVFAGDEDMTLEVATERLASIIATWTRPEKVFTAARLELFLIAHREPAIAEALAEVRRAFRALAQEWLNDLSPEAGQHAKLLMALIEGITSNQLLHKEGQMSPNEIKWAIRNFLVSIGA